MTVIISGDNGVSDVDGSAGTPAIRGTDANTGIFFPAADRVGVSTGGTQRVEVDASGNVGIGTSSPESKLAVKGSSGNADLFSISDIAVPTSGAEYGVAMIKSTSTDYLLNLTAYNTNGKGLRVYNTGTTAANYGLLITRDGADSFIVDGVGDLYAGTTATLDGSRATFTKANAAGVAVNRTSGDGALYRCYRDGTSVGYIGTLDNNSIFIGNFQTNSVALRFIGATNDIRPCDALGLNRDNAVDFGDSGARFVNIWATNGTIQTSDANEKQDIEELSEAETRVAVALKGLLRKYRWKHRVATEGDDARIHFGIIAQDLKAAFEAEGLDAHRYSMFTWNEWWEFIETYTDDEGVEQTRTNTYDTEAEAPEGAVRKERMGIRYNELLAFMVAAL